MKNILYLYLFSSLLAMETEESKKLAALLQFKNTYFSCLPTDVKDELKKYVRRLDPTCDHVFVDTVRSQLGARKEIRCIAIKEYKFLSFCNEDKEAAFYDKSKGTVAIFNTNNGDRLKELCHGSKKEPEVTYDNINKRYLTFCTQLLKIWDKDNDVIYEKKFDYLCDAQFVSKGKITLCIEKKEVTDNNRSLSIWNIKDNALIARFPLVDQENYFLPRYLNQVFCILDNDHFVTTRLTKDKIFKIELHNALNGKLVKGLHTVGDGDKVSLDSISPHYCTLKKIMHNGVSGFHDFLVTYDHEDKELSCQHSLMCSICRASFNGKYLFYNFGKRHATTDRSTNFTVYNDADKTLILSLPYHYIREYAWSAGHDFLVITGTKTASPAESSFIYNFGTKNLSLEEMLVCKK